MENSVKRLEVNGRAVWVKRGKVHGGGELWVYDAWEESGLMGPHSTIMSRDSFGESGPGWFGRLGCRRFPCDLPAYSKERSDFVMAEFNRQYEEAYLAIVEAFPEAAAGRRSMGSIDVFGSA